MRDLNVSYNPGARIKFRSVARDSFPLAQSASDNRPRPSTALSVIVRWKAAKCLNGNAVARTLLAVDQGVGFSIAGELLLDRIKLYFPPSQ